MALNIEIKTIPHKEQRYPTAGDWYYENGKLIICVSDMGDWKKETLIALHELVEVLLCKSDGVSQKAVDNFDLNFSGEGEPGDDINAPYYKQHQIASIMERLMCFDLGLSWQEYDLMVNKVMNNS